MMTVLIFLGALSVGMASFELLDSLLEHSRMPGRLQGIRAENPVESARRSTWAVLLAVLLPGYFQAARATGRRDVVDLLRRAGYPYSSVGEFFAAAISTFTVFLALGALTAGLLHAMNTGIPVSVGVAAIFIILGLRRPYTKLKNQARRRAAGLRSNMLSGLATLNALLTAGVGVQESMRRSAAIGGPFCNLLGLLVAQMEVAPFMKALDVVEAHLPDPADIEAGLFLRSVREFYNQNRPLLPAVTGLQAAVQRDVLEMTEARAALVRQRSGLFGIFAVLGLVITIIAPFIGVFS